MILQCQKHTLQTESSHSPWKMTYMFAIFRLLISMSLRKSFRDAVLTRSTSELFSPTGYTFICSNNLLSSFTFAYCCTFISLYWSGSRHFEWYTWVLTLQVFYYFSFTERRYQPSGAVGAHCVLDPMRFFPIRSSKSALYVENGDHFDCY